MMLPNIQSQCVDLFETYVGLEFFIDESVNLMNRHFAFGVDLDFCLDVLVVDIRSFLDI